VPSLAQHLLASTYRVTLRHRVKALEEGFEGVAGDDEAVDIDSIGYGASDLESPGRPGVDRPGDLGGAAGLLDECECSSAHGSDVDGSDVDGGEMTFGGGSDSTVAFRQYRAGRRGGASSSGGASTDPYQYLSPPLPLTTALARSTVSLTVVNNSLFLPVTFVLQHEYVDADVGAAAVECAEDDMRDRGEEPGMEEPPPESSPTEELTTLPTTAATSNELTKTIISSVLIGASAVATGGVSVLAGGVLTLAVGGSIAGVKEGLRIRRDKYCVVDDGDCDKNRGDATNGSEEPNSRMSDREKLLEEKMVELSKLATDTLEEARVKHVGECEVYNEKIVLLKQQFDNLNDDCISQQRRFDDKEREYIIKNKERDAEQNIRENDLIQSVIELEASVRKMKREKKVLVQEIKESRSRWEEKEIKLRGEAQQAIMMWNSVKGVAGVHQQQQQQQQQLNPPSSTMQPVIESPLNQLKQRYAKLQQMLKEEPGNEELRMLVGNIKASIDAADREEEKKKGLNFMG
jgi:hypothetical protein